MKIESSQITYRELEEKDRQQMLEFRKKILSTITNDLWFMPFDDVELNSYFDKNICYSLCAVDGEKIVGFVNLTKDIEDYQEILKPLKLQHQTIWEYGRGMVLPEYRGHNIMLEINKRLLQQAKILKINYLVTTVHPDNIASCTSVNTLGMTKFAVFERAKGYIRNAYIIKV